MNRFVSNTRPKPVSAACQRTLHLPLRLPLKALVLATACALSALPRPSHAQSIGALDVRSRLGEAFFAAVPVRTADGILDPRCIRVLPNPNAPQGATALQGIRVRIGSADTVLIETAGAVSSPVVGLRLEVGCDSPVARDFVVLDERPSLPDRPALASADTAPAAAPVPAAVRRRAAAPAAGVQAAPRPAATTSTAASGVRPMPARTAAPAATRGTPPAAEATDSDARRVAELRARSDDQAAALLALDDRLALLQKQAEALKLQLEQTLATMPAKAVNTAATAATTTAATAANSTATAASGASASQPSTASAAAAAAPAMVPAAAAGSLAAPVSAHPERGPLDLLTDWKVAGGLAALLLGAFAFKLRRRPTFKSDPAEAASAPWANPSLAASDAHERTVPQMRTAVDPGAYSTTRPISTRMPAVDQTAEWIPPPTTDSLPVPFSQAAAAMLPGAAMTREFHITQKFQPESERLVALSSPEEIVQQARTHYMEDGDVFKAIDLLEMAVAARQDSVRPWQALFAIYRRENMPERFQRLALAYRDTFGPDESWPAILALGRHIDPVNPLYAAEADGAPLPEDLVERWLGVPLDFTAHLLANEMHDQLMDTYSGFKRRKGRAAE